MIKSDGLYQFYGNFSVASGISFEAINFHPAAFEYNHESYHVVVLGNPIVGEKIDKTAAAILAADALANGESARLQELNGEFSLLIHNRSSGDFYIINDRFASIPIYYLTRQDKFIFSVRYNDLWLNEGLEKEVNPLYLLESAWFTRLIGDKTLDDLSRFLSSATVLTLRQGLVDLKKYWHPSFEKSSGSLNSLAGELAESIKQSIRYKTSDNPDAGLFLSGGIDSRTILAAFEKPPVCYTLTIGRNLEYQVAKRAADIVGSQHVYLPMPEDKYTEILKTSSKLSAGMYAYDHAIFLGYGEEVRKTSKVAFHGHGIDYMFQGMYLPVRRVNVMGKVTSFTKLGTFPDDYARFFVDEVPYRTKYVDFLSYLKPSVRNDFYEGLIASAKEVVAKSEGVFPTSYDKYEYLITSDISRHYSNPNISSLMSYMEQRTVVFENGVFDLFHRIPPEKKLDGKLARTTLKYLNKELAQLITANTKTRAISGPWEKTLMRTYDFLYAKVRKKLGNELFLNTNQRTWPLRDEAFQNEIALQAAIKAAATSEKLAALDVFEMDKVKKDVDHWLGQSLRKAPQNSLGGAFMTALVSINEFLSQ